MKQYNWQTILLSCILLIFLFSFFLHLYETGNEIIKKEADKALKNAVNKELESRFSKQNMPYSFTPSGFSDFEKLVITTEDGEIVYELDKEKEKDAITTNTEMRARQTFMLLKKQPIIPAHLDSIWHVELLDNNISAETVICIKTPLAETDADCNSKDSQFQQVYYAGLVHEIEISAGSTCSFWTIISKGDFGSWRTFLMALLVFVSGFIFVRSILLRKRVALASVNLEKTDVECVSNVFKIGDIVFDSSKRILIKEQGEIPVTSQACSLLLLFLSQPDYYLNNDDIIRELWGEPDLKSKERLQKAVSNLRRYLLIHLPGVIIETRSPGYKLCLNVDIIRM